MFKKELFAFVIGSSIFSWFITMCYIFSGWDYNRPNTFPIKYIPFMIPILFGLSNIFVNNLFVVNSLYQYTIIMAGFGAIFGLLASMFGIFVLKAHIKIFGQNQQSQYKFIFVAPILYAFIWGVIINILNNYFDVVDF